MRASGRPRARDTSAEGWRVGVDLGGTWIRIIAVDSRGRRRTARAASPGLDGLPALLRRLWRRWDFRRDDVRTLVVASRGVWTRAERARHARRLGALARDVTVMADVEAAHLGALGDAAGILLLAGTGSMAFGRDARGRWARAGGFGPLLGDEGSAFWIGREWLRATMGTTGFARSRRILSSSEPVARVAALAPAVLQRARRGQRAARVIVTRSQEALADLLVTIVRELRLTDPIRVSWSGGLLADTRFRQGVWRAARRRRLVVVPSAPRRSPIAAALVAARHAGSRPMTVRRRAIP